MEATKINLVISGELNKILNKIFSFSTDMNVLMAISNLRILEDTSISYLGVAEQDRSKISYLTLSKINQMKIDDSYWNKDMRIMARPSRVLNYSYYHIRSLGKMNLHSY